MKKGASCKLQTEHSLQTSALQGTASGILSLQCAKHNHKSSPIVSHYQLISIRKDKAWTSKHWGINLDLLAIEGGGGCSYITSTATLSSEIIYLICIVQSYLLNFCALVSLTLFDFFICMVNLSLSLSMFSAVLNLRVAEMGQADHWSLCQIVVKREVEVSHGWV